MSPSNSGTGQEGRNGISAQGRTSSRRHCFGERSLIHLERPYIVKTDTMIKQGGIAYLMIQIRIKLTQLER